MERRSRDLLPPALLAVACLAIRLPALDRVALNPDESQYEATASYLLGTGESAFALPYGVPWTTALYKAIGSVFGPYSMVEVRLAVLAIALVGAWILYDLVRRETGPLWGLAAGLISLYYALYFEGHTANREWFSGIAALAGYYLYLRCVGLEGRRRLIGLVLAGFVCGACLWFKRQASFLVLVVPATVLWEAAVERRLRRVGPVLLPFAAGGLAAGVVFVAPFFFHGTADIYLGSLVADYTLFAQKNAELTREAAGGGAGLYLHHLYGRLPFRGAALIAYLFCGLVLVAAAARIKHREREWKAVASPTTVLFALYLVAAIGCVQLGNRFLNHYYLYWVPPAAALLALAGGKLQRALPRGVPAKLALAAATLWLVDRVAAFAGLAPSQVRSAGPAGALVAVYLVAGAAVLIYGLRRPLERAGRVIALLVLLETGSIVVDAQLRPAPPSFPYHPDGFATLVERIDRDRRPGDLLFVWGWLPEIYSATRMEAASHMTITQYAVDDYYVTYGEPRLVEPMVESMMDDLRRRKPAFVVDAAERSWTLLADGNPRLYRLGNYPELELRAMLEQEYRFVGTFDGCDLHVRRR